VESFPSRGEQENGKARVTMKLTANSAGYDSMASPTLAALPKNELAWGMIPGNWYGRELEYNMNLAGRYSQGVPGLPLLANEQNSGTLSPMISWMMTGGRIGTHGKSTAMKWGPRETRTRMPS
jgi:hypothetical protein